MSEKFSPKWVQFRAAGYCLGKGIHYGCHEAKIYSPRAQAPGRWCVGIDPRGGGANEICDAGLDGLAQRAFDWVLLGDVWQQHSRPEQLFKESIERLRNGGHLLVSSKGPQNGSAPDTPPKVPELPNSFHRQSWVLKDSQERDGVYLGVYKLTRGGQKGIRANPKPDRPRACIARYGALGDQVIITPLIRKLSEDGYHVTVNGQRTASEVLRHNPFLDNLIIQERDFIFNPDLGEYWREWEKEYDKYINLSESVEGDVLKVENRLDYYVPAEVRRANAEGVNWYDLTMARAGYPELRGERGELYFSRKEEKEVGKVISDLRASGARFLILWGLKGSSYHKIYPFAKRVISEFLRRKSDAAVIITGGADAEPFRFEHPKVMDLVNQWPFRRIALLAREVDLVVGPETGLLNAAGCFDTPKILFLSHSREDNISKHWKNCVALEPDTEIAQCYPCFQLNYTLEACPMAVVKGTKGENKVPICTVAIQPERVFAELEQAYAHG